MTQAEGTNVRVVTIHVRVLVSVVMLSLVKCVLGKPALDARCGILTLKRMPE